MKVINVVVGKKRNIRVSVNATADIISTSKNPVTLKNVPTFGGIGGFVNGQSIEVNNFVITGTLTANNSNGYSHYYLKTTGNTVFWSYGSDFPFEDYGDLSLGNDGLGVNIFDYSYDCNADGPVFVVDLGTL